MTRSRFLKLQILFGNWFGPGQGVLADLNDIGGDLTGLLGSPYWLRGIGRLSGT